MQVTVASIHPPKPGGKRSSIKTSTGAYIGFDAERLSFDAGKTYDIDVKEHEFQGKTYQTATRINTAVSAASSNVGPAPGSYAALDRWYMPFVSNTVAHAIASGYIKDASQILIWARAAKVAAMRIESIVNLDEYDEQPPEF